MSFIGEARSFRKRALELDKQLKTTTDPEQRRRLRQEIMWFAEEAEACWRCARQEAREDARSERYVDDYDDYDECEDECDDCTCDFEE